MVTYKHCRQTILIVTYLGQRLEFTNDIMQVISHYILIQNFKNECFEGFYFKWSILNNYVKFNETKPCKLSRQTLLKATCVGKH